LVSITAIFHPLSNPILALIPSIIVIFFILSSKTKSIYIEQYEFVIKNKKEHHNWTNENLAYEGGIVKGKGKISKAFSGLPTPLFTELIPSSEGRRVPPLIATSPRHELASTNLGGPPKWW